MCGCAKGESENNPKNLVPSVCSGSSCGSGLLGSWNGCFLDSHCHITPLDSVLQERFLNELKVEYGELTKSDGDVARGEANSSDLALNPCSERRSTGGEDDLLSSNVDDSLTKNLELEHTSYKEGGGVVLCGTDPSADWCTIDTLLTFIARHPRPFSSSSSKLSEAELNDSEEFGVKFDATSYDVIAGNSSSTRLTKGVKDPQHGGLFAYGGISCQFYAGFGIHPWYVAPQLHDNHAALLALEEYLVHHPKAIVGEVGLDALRGPPLEEVQVPVFIAQLRLAAAFHRPVSMHCVRAYPVLQRILNGQGKSAKGTDERPQSLGGQEMTNGSTTTCNILSSGETPFSHCCTTLGDDNGKTKKMSSYLLHALASPVLCAEDLPPAIILHGFSGSVEIAKALLRLKPLTCRESVEGLHSSRSGSGRDTLGISPAPTPVASPTLERSSNYCPPSHLQRREKEMCEVQTVDSSSSQSGSPVMKKKKLLKLSASQRLFFGVGAATTLRLKAATTSILLPLLIATHRVLVESDEFYTIRYQPPLYKRSEVDHPSSSSSLSNDILGRSTDNIITTCPTCNVNNNTTSSLSWSLPPRSDVIIDAPSTAVSSVYQVIDALSPFVLALPSDSLPSPVPPLPCSHKVSSTSLEESVARKKENNTIPDGATSAPVGTDLRTAKPDLLTPERETKKGVPLLDTKSNTAFDQANRQGEPSCSTNRLCSCTGSSCVNEAVEKYLRRSFFNAFSSVM